MKNFDYVNHRGISFVKQLGWMNVKQRYCYFQILLIFKCIHGLAPQYLVNEIILECEVKESKTRKHPMNLYLPIPQNEFHRKMFFYRGARSWNELPNQLKECTNLNTFKVLLKKYIKAQPIENLL